MAFCSKCGAALKEGVKFCPECGAPIWNAPERTMQAAPQPDYPVQEKRKQKKRKGLLRRWWLWMLIIIVIGAVYSRNSAQKPSGAPRRTETTIDTTPASTARPTQKPSPTPTTESMPKQETPIMAESEIRPEVKEFLDAYEACMDEYVEFMQKYMNADPTGMVSMMSDYYSILTRYTEFAEKMDAFDESELTNAELAYYIEVTSRVSQKLLTVAGG